MKRICTQMAAVCLLFIAQNLCAQTPSVTIAGNGSGTVPSPNPNFQASTVVDSTTGFTSTNSGTFHDFAKGKADTITSPQYYYSSDQTAIYFIYNFTVANSGSTVTPKVLIITSNGDTISATAVQTTISGTGVNYYFTFSLATPLLAYTNFKIALIMTAGNKAVTANTLTTNAILGTPPAKAPLPLPVNFLSFYAKKLANSVSLTWNVATEENVSGYEVQRSSNGSDFIKIGFVNASQSSSYSFTDNNPIEMAYYRIKSIDIDGKYKYSSIVALKGQQSGVVLKAFPMPVQSQLTIQHASASTDSRIEVMSVDGRMIQTVSPANGAQQTNVDLSSAKPGVYVVRFINNNTAESLKIVKQ